MTNTRLHSGSSTRSAARTPSNHSFRSRLLAGTAVLQPNARPPGGSTPAGRPYFTSDWIETGGLQDRRPICPPRGVVATTSVLLVVGILHDEANTPRRTTAVRRGYPVAAAAESASEITRADSGATLECGSLLPLLPGEACFAVATARRMPQLGKAAASRRTPHGAPSCIAF